MLRPIALCLALLASVASAQDHATSVSSASVAADVSRIKERYPKTQFVSITPTPIPGVYQAIMANKRLAYIDASGRYFVFGRIFDMERTQDLTEPVLASLENVDVRALPLTDAIKHVKGNGRRTLYVFSDPDCPYCQQLERSLADLQDVTVYTFVFPISELHPQARNKAISVWCSTDRVAAWAAATSTRGQIGGTTSCDHPIDRNVELAKALGIRATPTMLSADGRFLRGVAPAERISAFLNQTTASVAQVTK